MFNQLVNYFNDHLPNIIPTAQNIEISSEVEFRSNDVQGALGFSQSRHEASHEVKSIVESIRTLAYTFADKDMYTFAQEYDCTRERKKLTAYLESDLFKQLKSEWSKFGVHNLSSVDEQIKKDHVGIYIERDEQGLVRRLKIASNFDLTGCSFDRELTEAPQDIERIKRFNLTYLKDLEGVERELKALSNNIEVATQKQRLKLLNEFNAHWENQLSATLTHIVGSRNLILNVIDVSGRIVASMSFQESSPLFEILNKNQLLLPENKATTQTATEILTQRLNANAGLILGVGLALFTEYLSHKYIKNDKLFFVTQAPRIFLYEYAGKTFQRWVNDQNKPSSPQNRPY